jgi:hypothetical protein
MWRRHRPNKPKEVVDPDLQNLMKVKLRILKEKRRSVSTTKSNDLFQELGAAISRQILLAQIDLAIRELERRDRIGLRHYDEILSLWSMKRR